MKLYYTDEKKNKRLIAEGEDVMDICEAAEDDAKTKFVHLKSLKRKSAEPEIYVFTSHNGEETGYSIEE